jgi:DNA-binding NarL/FixJ family response regulator
MDMTAYIRQAPAILNELRLLLEGKSMVACLEHMKWLGAFICIEAINPSLVGAATTEDEGYALIQTSRPDFLIASQTLEAGNGLSLIARTERLRPDTKTLLVIDDLDHNLVAIALKHGCDGICMKSESFMPALRTIAGGGVYVPRAVADALARQTPQALMEPLTRRETEVLQCLTLGSTDQDIASTLVISVETARTHLKRIYQKLHVSNRTQAAVKGIAFGLVALE